ncbi:DC-STAMP domain-containing protein 1 [Chelonia mydas]|uniref:DC-STAMP domain-containing protein 1 n=1 Tax=Chelonia mydas TaxID=8469 RepID=M7ASA0_CHEMY|nr:DC-STAMP domain-containing protein 1 [Chelonia mydas]
MSIEEGHKIKLMYGLAGVSALGWGVSPHFRCASLLVVPKFLGKEGRLYLLTYVLAAVYDGPVANMRHNLDEVIHSVGCTVELQINHSRQIWRVSTAPLRAMLRDLVGSSPTSADPPPPRAPFPQQRGGRTLNAETAGYGVRRPRRAQGRRAPSTQQMYEQKTKLRCKYVVDEAIRRCQAWFDAKHKACLRSIAVPLISHLLCLPMKFRFLCHVHEPQDTLVGANVSRERLTEEVASHHEPQDTLVGANVSRERLTEEVASHVRQQSARLDQTISVLRLLLSCTFLFIFIAAFSYTNHYNHDIRFDNLYVTTYFRQLDARRWKQMLELLECIPPLLFLLLAWGLDHVLYTMLSVIRHHSFVQYSFRSSHHLEVRVGGHSLLARLLRSTIGALNTSSEMALESTNLACLPQPQAMTQRDYLASCLPLGALVLLCLGQVYASRLHRTIAAFYFPKALPSGQREKKRVLFLYNELLHKRQAFVRLQGRRIARHARRHQAFVKPLLERIYLWCPRLRRCLPRYCVLCGSPESRTSPQCPTPTCGTTYCQPCWRDMGQICFACTPGHTPLSGESSSEEQMTYAD